MLDYKGIKSKEDDQLHYLASPDDNKKILELDLIDFNINFGVKVDREWNESQNLREFHPPSFLMNEIDMGYHSFYIP